MKISFFIPGKPAPGGSKKGFYIKSLNRVVIAPANSKTKPWMAIVSAYAKESWNGPLLQGPLKLSMVFRLLRPKNHYGTGKKMNVLKGTSPIYSTVKPDLTKLERSTEDALVGIIMRDDSQVAVKATSKVYTERDEGVFVSVEELNNLIIGEKNEDQKKTMFDYFSSTDS